MAAAVKAVEDGMSLRKAARLHNVPIETTRRRVLGKVEIECRPGPATVLSAEEEEQLVDYVVKMADMGFGLTREDLWLMAYRLAEKLGKSHPFLNGIAGRGWLDGFLARHPKLVLRSTQPLSYSRAVSANPETIKDHFATLGSIYARLNILSKPMQIYNIDECGVSIVHKAGKVITEVGRKNVWAISSGERGKNHTIVSCVSASGTVLPPFLIYPRKRVTDNLKEGAYPGTSFNCSDSGWITQDLYMEWFRFFLSCILPTRPVLLIEDGHSSHISVDLIELAREKSVHILCLPSHTTHLLQPLDVGVFKSFKCHYNNECRKYMMAHPGRTITTENIAALIGMAWSRSLTPLNIMAGFRKAGAYPLNPGVIDDRQVAPSLATKSPSLSPGSQDLDSSPSLKSVSTNASFSPEEEKMYRTRYEEGYDLPDSQYAKWLAINHPKDAKSCCSLVTHVSDNSSTSVLSEVLKLPQPTTPKRKRKPGFNTGKSVPITNDSFLENLINKEDEKMAKEEEKKAREEKKKTKQLEKEEEKKAKEEKKKAKQLEKERKIKEREEKRKAQPEKKRKLQQKETTTETKATKSGKKSSAKTTKETDEPDENEVTERLPSKRTVTQKQSDNGEHHIVSSDNESDAQCPVCGIFYLSDSSGTLWVSCDQCGSWLDFKCSGLKNPAKYLLLS